MSMIFVILGIVLIAALVFYFTQSADVVAPVKKSCGACSKAKTAPGAF
jgi:hypothetical protein